MTSDAPLPPAPGAELHPALDLANTVHAIPGGEVDLIGSRELATAWLARHRLLPAGTALGDPCTARLRTLRHALRELLTSATAATRPPSSALATVNDALAGAPSAEPLAWSPAAGLHRDPAHPLDRLTEHVLAALAADAANLLTGEDATKIAQCGANSCTRFLLRTHAARQWCSVRCGDRVRAARAYARRGGR